MRRRIPGVTTRRPILHIIRAVATPLGALLALAACADRLVVPPQSIDAKPSVASRLTCVADVRAATVACSPSERSAGGRAANYSLVLGGQGMYVQLTATNSNYSAGTQLFSADITVQNLTALQLGTTDGSTVSGVKLFLSDGPAVTGGTGSVSVNNADGTATFTASNQPFFAYNQILEPFSGTSAPKTWQFNVPASVTTFTFSVLTQASAPDETGVLRWMPERGNPVFPRTIWGADPQNVFGCGNLVCYRQTPVGWRAMNGPGLVDSTGSQPSWLGMSGTSATDVWAVGSGGAIAHFDGSRWQNTATPVGFQLNAAWARTPTDVWAAGISGNKILHYDGTSWSVAFNGTFGIWTIQALSATDVWAAGVSGLVHFNGTTWTTIPLPSGAQAFRGMWAVSDNDIWVGSVGGTSTLYHYNGTSFTPVLPSPSVGTGRSLWGTSPSNIWAAMDDGNVLRYDGSSWSLVTVLPTTSVSNIWASSATDVWWAGWQPYAAGTASGQYGGPPVHYDGTTWTTAGTNMQNLQGMWGSSSSNIYAVGINGTILHHAGTGWAAEASGTSLNLTSVWGSGPADVWAVGQGGTVLHSAGSTWTAASSATPRRLISVWGSAPNSVWAVGDTGTIVRFNGSSWSVELSGTTRQLTSVFGTSGSDVWATGVTGTLLHYNGTSWSSSPGVTSDMTFTAGWAASPTDAWIIGSQVVGTTGSRLLMHWDGSTWSERSLPFSGFLSCISGSSASDVWVGTEGGMYHWNGSAWSIVPTGALGLCVWNTSPTNVYGFGTAGLILHGTR